MLIITLNSIKARAYVLLDWEEYKMLICMHTQEKLQKCSPLRFFFFFLHLMFTGEDK